MSGRQERYDQVLEMLHRDPPPTRREIASELNVSHQYVTQIVADLVVLGRVTRQAGKARTTRAVRANLKAEPETL